MNNHHNQEEWLYYGIPQKIKTGTGYVAAMTFKRNLNHSDNEENKKPKEDLEKEKKMYEKHKAINRKSSYKEMHEKLIHVGRKTVEGTCKDMAIDMTDDMEPCEACALAKIKIVKLPKVTENNSETPRESLFLDMSYLERSSLGGNKYCILLVDEDTGFKWSGFVKNIDDFPGWIEYMLQNIKNIGMTVKFIRLDNSGDNNKLEYNL